VSRSRFAVYPPTDIDRDGFTAEQVKRGETWLYTDVTCGHCGKEQPVAATGYVGGPCIRCGRDTIPTMEDDDANR